MDETEFLKWKQVREKGVGIYFLKHILSYCVIFTIVCVALNLFLKYYSFEKVFMDQIGFYPIIILVGTGKWFFTEKKYKAYLKAFNKK